MGCAAPLIPASPLLLSSVFQLLAYEYRFGNLKMMASREQMPIAMG